MGFFSWNCKACGESIKGCPCEHMAWQQNAVLLKQNGSRVIGEYDGYGRIDDTDFSSSEPELWHEKCWREAGCPEYSGPSDYAQDQGFFVNCPECVKYRDEHPWQFDEHGQELRCVRWQREEGDKWGCEEENCPHYKDSDDYCGTCEHPDRESNNPLEVQDGSL